MTSWFVTLPNILGWFVLRGDFWVESACMKLLAMFAGWMFVFGHVFVDCFHQKLNGTESQRTPKLRSSATSYYCRYSGFFGVRGPWVLLEISWIASRFPPPHDFLWARKHWQRNTQTHTCFGEGCLCYESSPQNFRTSLLTCRRVTLSGHLKRSFLRSVLFVPWIFRWICLP